jgi:hypothetical protein
MTSARNTGRRNLRNNPYLFDELGGRFHRTAAGMLWRWRTELSALAALAALTLWLITLITVIGALALVLGLALMAGVIPPARRFITRHAWCVLTRHRLQHLCWEARLHTRAGRLPLILWIKPTPVGVRAFVLCRAGICAEDFEAHIGEIRAACYARDARVTRHPRWSQLVTIDVVRHDPLTPDRHIPSQVLDHPRPPRPAWPELPGEEAS